MKRYIQILVTLLSMPQLACAPTSLPTSLPNTYDPSTLTAIGEACQRSLHRSLEVNCRHMILWTKEVQQLPFTIDEQYVKMAAHRGATPEEKASVRSLIDMTFEINSKMSQIALSLGKILTNYPNIEDHLSPDFLQTLADASRHIYNLRDIVGRFDREAQIILNIFDKNETIIKEKTSYKRHMQNLELCIENFNKSLENCKDMERIATLHKQNREIRFLWLRMAVFNTINCLSPCLPSSLYDHCLSLIL